jgi:hypothetical protein
LKFKKNRMFTGFSQLIHKNDKKHLNQPIALVVL